MTLLFSASYYDHVPDLLEIYCGKLNYDPPTATEKPKNTPWYSYSPRVSQGKNLAVRFHRRSCSQRPISYRGNARYTTSPFSPYSHLWRSSQEQINWLSRAGHLSRTFVMWFGLCGQNSYMRLRSAYWTWWTPQQDKFRVFWPSIHSLWLPTIFKWGGIIVESNRNQVIRQIIDVCQIHQSHNQKR